jgi:hypothetical protein
MARYSETISVPFTQISQKDFLEISQKIITSSSSFITKLKVKTLTVDFINFSVYRLSLKQGEIEIQCNSFNNTVDIHFISFGNPQSWTNRVGKTLIQSFLSHIKSALNDYLKNGVNAEKNEKLSDIINRHSEDYKYSQIKYHKKIAVILGIVLLFSVIVALVNSQSPSICNCQKSWEFIYLSQGGDKVNKYTGEIYSTIDTNGVNQGDILINCGKKYGNKYLPTGFTGHPDYKECK